MPIPKSTSAAEQAEELRRIGVEGDDTDTEIDSRQRSRRSNERRPRTIQDLSPDAVYARFNNPAKGKLGAAED